MKKLAPMLAAIALAVTCVLLAACGADGAKALSPFDAQRDASAVEASQAAPGKPLFHSSVYGNPAEIGYCGSLYRYAGDCLYLTLTTGGPGGEGQSRRHTVKVPLESGGKEAFLTLDGERFLVGVTAEGVEVRRFGDGGKAEKAPPLPA